MANCEIKRYDKLPGRIGLIDVDALRYALFKADKDLGKILKRKFKIHSELEKAIKEQAKQK